MNDEEEDERNIEQRLSAIEDTLDRLTFVIEEIRESVSTEDYERKIKTTNSMIQNLNDLDEKVTDNLNRLNEMLKKLKGVVGIAIGNLAQ